MKQFLETYAYHITLVVATISLIGSLYFSNVLGYPPCELCWWQRIAIYPLVPLMIVAIRRNDTNGWRYGLPLIAIGWIISLYHNLLYYEVLPQSIKPCQAGISCTAKYIEWFGFLTIPLLAFIALTLMLIALGCYANAQKRGV